MFHGGPSRKQGPRLAMRDADDEPPRDAPVRPCEWPSENFMDRAGIKEEFNAYLRNADLVSFEVNCIGTLVRRRDGDTSGIWTVNKGKPNSIISVATTPTSA